MVIIKRNTKAGGVLCVDLEMAMNGSRFAAYKRQALKNA